MWAGKESVLSLDDRTYTYIVWTVKLVLGDLALAVMYGLDTVIHAKRIAPQKHLRANNHQLFAIKFIRISIYT